MSNNKLPKIALFLGAGASKPLGKPTTKELRDELIEEYKELVDELRKKYAGRSNPEVNELLIRKYLLSILTFDKFDDIEHVLQALKEIDDFFAEPRYGGRFLHRFITGEYGDKISTDSVNVYSFSEYVKTIPEQRRRLEKHIFDFYRWNHDYDGALSQIYDPLFREIKKYSRDIRIFTTNYDRAVEVYCSNRNRRCRCIDGFRFDEYIRRGIWDGNFDYPLVEGVTNVYLYKLHGSLDWKKHKTHGIEAIGEESRTSDTNYGKDMLVYPTLSPKEGQGVKPYSTIRKNFKTFMQSADVCIVIGFSFRDGHINRIFSDFVKRGGGTIIVVSPSAEENIDKNLLGNYGLSQTEKTSESDDENIMIYDLNGTNIIAINDKMTVEGAKEIVEEKIRPYLSSQTGRQGS